MRFYRGISVPENKVEAIITKIKRDGLSADDGEWKFAFSPPNAINELFNKEGLTSEDTRPSTGEAAVCASGDELGAAYYACKHNLNEQCDTPVMITFEAPLDRAAVDGRDFLYAAFQMGQSDLAKSFLEYAFGEAVIKYAEKAWSIDDQQQRIALCDLAIYDPDIVAAHYKNDMTIGGRYGTIFNSAFLVKLPVQAAEIVDVKVYNKTFDRPQPDMTLDELISRN